jgi:CelD/BcsL family acetyltransferase involved in cellulose biosynthesis
MGNGGKSKTNMNEACVVQVADPADMTPHLAAWNELAREAIEPNPFYEPFCLLPALRLFAASGGIRILLIWNGAGPERQLVGLLPVQSAKVSPWLSVHAWMPWQHHYCFLTTPLIHRNFADEAAQSLLAWFGRAGQMAVLSCVGGGAFSQSVGREAKGLNLGLAQAESRYRAFFQAMGSADAYWERSLSGKHRKGYRRVERQLAAMGDLEYKTLSNEPGAEEWIADFLALEAAGWKGKAGTAFAQAPADRAYFAEMIAEAHAQGRLMGLGLYLDGRPVAMKANLLAADGGFCFKICYDESFAKYSPGVLLELENVRVAHRLGLAWMDSCADPDHPMIDRLWPERREIQTMFVAPKWLGIGSPAGPIAALRRAKRAIDRFAKRRKKSHAHVERTVANPAEVVGEATC